MKELTANHMLRGLKALNAILPRNIKLIVGGGGAMLLAHSFPLSTSDIDAIPQGLSNDELKPFIESVAKDLDFPTDWLNPWFGSFTHVLPHDFADRLIEVFKGDKILALALGRDDLLLMKCFAHRKKDIAHARALVRAGANTEFVFSRIDDLEAKRIPGTREARAFCEEIIEMEET